MDKSFTGELEQARRDNAMVYVNTPAGLATDMATLGSFYKLVPAMRMRPIITRVLFNDPATIVWFSDGDKVVCVCDEQDYFDKEKGVLHCIAKKFMGSTEVKRVSVEWEEDNIVDCEEDNILLECLGEDAYRDLIYGKIPESNTINNARLGDLIK